MKRLLATILAGTMLTLPLMVSAAENTDDIREKIKNVSAKAICEAEDYYREGICGGYTNHYELEQKAREAEELLNKPDATDEELENYYNELLRCIESVGWQGGCTAPHKIGDANWDYKVDIMDATVIQRALANCSDPYFIKEESYDIDGDRLVTIKDVTAIQRGLTGMGDINLLEETFDNVFTLSQINYWYRPNIIKLKVEDFAPFSEVLDTVSLTILDENGDALYENLEARYVELSYGKARKCYYTELDDNRKYMMAEKTYKLIYTTAEGEQYETEVTPQPFDSECII